MTTSGHWLLGVGGSILFLGLGSLPALAVGAGNNLLPDIPVGPNTAKLEVLTTVGSRVTGIAHARDGSGRLFIVQPQGLIRVYKQGVLLPTPFLNAPASPPDRAMTGLAFHPDHQNNGKLYVITGEAVPNGHTPDYTPPQDDTDSAFDNVLFEYRVSAGNPDVVDPATQRELLRVHEAHRLHNVDDIAFGGDGYLYLAVGDGGDTRTGTPTNYNTTAQQLSNPYGKILRIDVDHIGPNGRYAIPPDNPFAGSGVPEIYAWGVRNPWRITADLLTGEVYTAVNGDITIEQIYRVGLGQNYGWDAREGGFLWNPTTGEATVDPNPPPQYTLPLARYDHNTTTKAYGSIIGGYVYRGSRVPQLYGLYLGFDYLGFEMISMDPQTGQLRRITLDPTGQKITQEGEITWGEGDDGELYIGRDNGQILRFVYPAVGDVAGSVPDGDGVPGTPLKIGKGPAGQITLSWGGSCRPADNDYAVYEGAVGNWTSHASKFCSTQGQPTKTLAPAPGSAYYLVVPRHGLREGSYGQDGEGNERAPAHLPCLLQALAPCG